MDPGIFTTGISGEYSKENVSADFQSQSDNDKENSSSESDVEMRETEKTHTSQVGSGKIADPDPATHTDPGKASAEPVKISELSAAEIKKKYYEIMAKENLSQEKTLANPPLPPRPSRLKPMQCQATLTKKSMPAKC
jgi:hypothetical protein